MKIPQLSIFIENRSGKLAEITSTLGEAGISIRAMSLADTSEFGILRMVVDDPDRARRMLKDYGYAVSLSEVIAVEIADRPGALGELLSTFADAGQNVDYLYAFVQKDEDSAVMILRLEELDQAIETLQARGISLLPCCRIVKE